MKYTNLLSFDSIYMLFPIRKLYLYLLRKISVRENGLNARLILYRLDKENIFLDSKINISGSEIGASYQTVDRMSVEFFRYLEKSKSCSYLSINNVPLYQIYPRQVKLKLEGVLRGALRIRNLVNSKEECMEVITDTQTASIMSEAFKFLNYTPTNLIWKPNVLLTLCISINSLFMRFFSIVNYYISSSRLPKVYFYKHVSSKAPTVLITTPKNRPEDFFFAYVKEFNNRFNIVLYSLGVMAKTPKNYKRIEFKRTKQVLRGIFTIKNLMFSSDSYIADVILIFKNHQDLSLSIDAANALFSNQIDVHISRLQTNAVDSYLAIEARRRGIFILGDVEEEIFYCDSAVCSSPSEETESLRLALSKGGKIFYKGTNSMIKYRFENYRNVDHYLHDLLKVDVEKEIIFYASSPWKEENQRYLTEKFLIDFFSSIKKYVLVIKTHPQDNGNVTNIAYLNSLSPSDVILIGDIKQEHKIISSNFKLFSDFNFNAAIASSGGFLTMSSSAILQALLLGVKTGLVDFFNNAFYENLVHYQATRLIESEKSLRGFLDNKKVDISDDILEYCGLKNSKEKLDLEMHLLKCLEEFEQNKSHRLTLENILGSKESFNYSKK